MIQSKFKKKEMTKLKRSKTKLILVATIGILALILTIASVQGWGRTFNLRPIDDWIYGVMGEDSIYTPGPNNPTGAPGGFSGYDYDDNWYFTYFDPLAFMDYKYSGFILEEVMSDGALKYTVYLLARDIYMEVFNAQLIDEGFVIEQDIVLIGTISYVFQIKFVLESSYDGVVIPDFLNIPGGEREAGCELPPIWMMLSLSEELGARILSGKFIGIGSGDLMEPGSYWDWDSWTLVPPPVPTGETAKVFVNQQFTIDEFGVDTWSAESIIVF